MLDCHDITFKRGEKVIFQHLSLKLSAGESLLLSGSNGSGKTSLLRLISGLLRGQGEISWEGNSIAANFHHYVQQFCYCGHKPAVKPQLTPLENLTFWARLADREDSVADTLEYFDLSDVADVPCYQLSAGWQKRVSMARLLVSPAKLWLLDEPFTSLDEAASGQLQELITRHCEQGNMVIVTSNTSILLTFTHKMNMDNFSGNT